MRRVRGWKSLRQMLVFGAYRVDGCLIRLALRFWISMQFFSDRRTRGSCCFFFFFLFFSLSLALRHFLSLPCTLYPFFRCSLLGHPNDIDLAVPAETNTTTEAPHQMLPRPEDTYMTSVWAARGRWYVIIPAACQGFSLQTVDQCALTVYIV